MPFLQIICLANSRKYHGRCIAGVRTDGRGWVRPVVHYNYGALSPADYTLPDGTEPRMLDVLEVDLAEPRPEPHQPENWMIGRRQWRLVARPAPNEARQVLRAHLVHGPDLLGNQLDRVSCDTFAAAPAPASLALVYPVDLRWRITVDGYSGKHKIRACFMLGEAYYDLSLTDPVCEARLLGIPTGAYPLSAAGFADDDRVVLTVSLGEPLSGYCYKLVAAVFAVPHAWRR